MATIVTRAGKGSALTHNEVDANFTNLNTDKVESSALATVATTGAYSDLTGTPTLATVATTGAYSDLSGTPTIPTDFVSAASGGTFTGNVDFSAGIDVTGNVTVTGTVDGVDIATRDGVLTTTTTTANAALPKAGGTMTGAITFAAGQTFDGRDVSADGAKLDGIESGATADQTAAEILTAIKTVDGSGSGLDADTVDGIHASSFAQLSGATFTGDITVSGGDIILGGTGRIQGIDTVTDATDATSKTYVDTAVAGAGGGGSYDFTASGAISNGDAVVLNSDGTVSVVAGVSQSSGTPVSISGETPFFYMAGVFDSSNNKVVVVYSDSSNSRYGTAVVGTVSGTSISFGTPVVFESAQTDRIVAVFDTSANKVVVSYADIGNSTYGTSIVGTVSGTSISFGTPVVFVSSTVTSFASVFDTTNNKTVVTYRKTSSSGPYAIVGTVSGTSISFGGEVQIDGTNSRNSSITYDAGNDRLVYLFTDSSEYTYVSVGYVSGSATTWGTKTNGPNYGNYTYTRTVEYDPSSGKVLFLYSDGADPQYLYGRVGTVSGTSISYGTASKLSTQSSSMMDYGNMATYDSGASVIVMPWSDNSANIYVYNCAISGTSVSATSYTVDSSAQFAGFAACAVVYDSNSKALVANYADGLNSDYFTSVVYYNPSSNVTDYIGIAEQAISDTATGTVTVMGGVNESQSGLTIGSKYYLDNSGSLTTTVTAGREVGRALSATDILLTTGEVT